MSRKKKNTIDLTQFEDRAALCPHFGVCGGCTYQKIPYEKQLEIKSSEVTELIRTVYPDFEFEGIIPSPSEEGYRNKMEFTFGDECKDGPFALGLHQKGSFMNIVNVTDCHLVHNDMNLIRNETRNFFNRYYEKKEVDFRNSKTHVGWLRHLLVRRSASTGEIMVGLVTASKEASGCENICRGMDEILIDEYRNLLENLQTEGKIVGILHITNDALSDIVQSDRTDIIYGRDYIYEEIMGLKFKVSIFSFFQTNTRGAELLYGKAREYAADAHGLLFDLYSGTGTIAQMMSSVVDRVVGVEIVEDAVEAAKDNAELNGIQNAEFIAADVLKALEYIGKPDSLILDPPREGINPRALGKILSWGVEQVIYISCKPSSLARDLQAFKIAGYELNKACCVDMFPQTVHVETCVLLTKTSEAQSECYRHSCSGEG